MCTAGARHVHGTCILMCMACTRRYVPSLRKWVVMDAGPGLDYSTHDTDASGTPLNSVEMHALVGPSPAHPGASKLMAFKTTKLNSAPSSLRSNCCSRVWSFPTAKERRACKIDFISEHINHMRL